MTDKIRKSIQYLLTVFFAFALVLGLTVSANTKTAKAANVSVNFSEVFIEGDNPNTGFMQVRMNTNGLTWNGSYNDKLVSELPGNVATHTVINGRSLLDIANACDSTTPVRVTLQPAGTFSFIRVFIPLDFMITDSLRSVGILEGWSFTDTTGNGSTYSSDAVTYLRTGDVMGLAENYTANTKLTSSDIVICDASIVHRSRPERGADSYVFDVDFGFKICGEYDAMYNAGRLVRSAIYINGKSINEWNSQKIAEDSRFSDPNTYSFFPQNSTEAGHPEWFAKPIGVWGTSTGFRITVFQELLSSCETITVSVGQGCTYEGKFMVAETVTKTVFTQTAVDLTDKLTFLDNSHHNPTTWGETKLYFIHTNNESCWTKSPLGGCLNELDPHETGGNEGGQIQMKYIYFNGSSLWDINKNDNGSYESTQDNIKNGGNYAPITVIMSTEFGSSLKLHVPTNFTNGKTSHEEIVIKKGFSVYENGVSYYVSNDVIFTNNNGSWVKEIKGNEIKTEVTGIVTKANRTDGGNNENFVIFQLSKNDYNGLNTTAITDISSLYGYIDIGGTIINSYNGEKFFNVWGVLNSVAFRFADATTLQNVKYITIKAGAKFPSYNSQNGGALTYFVTSEDVTFIHNVPNDTWTVGAPPASEYTVTFTVGDETYHTSTVESGNTVSAPSNPTKAEDADYTYTFNCWTLNGVEYDFSTPVTQDITLVANFIASPHTFSGDLVTIDNPRVEGDANELYKVDITSSAWTITCNKYDFMYGGNFAEYRKYILINGVSVYDINANTDDSSYTYSTFPMTGNNDDLFAHPILIETHVQEGVGDPTKITLWMHKDYLNSLGDEIVVTLGKGYNAYTGGKTLDNDVNYDMTVSVTINNGTNLSTVNMIKGSTLAYLGTPSKDMTETALYEFDNWYIAGTNNVYDIDLAIENDISVEARFIEIAISLKETTVSGIIYSVAGADGGDRWLIISLSNHDYSNNVVQYGVTLEELNRLGFPEKVIIKGGMTVGETAKTEATVAEIFAANGSGEARYINVWESQIGSFAIRLPKVSTISEIVIEEGCTFPSYAYVSGATSEDVRYTVMRSQTYRLTNDFTTSGENTYSPQAEVDVDIKMEFGASVRIASDITKSGLRFTTLVSKADVAKLKELLGDASKGYTEISFGTLIVPTDYLMGGQFTHKWLINNYGEGKYLDIISTATLDQLHDYKNDDNYYCYYASIVKLNESNYDREFSAVGYVKLVKNGEIEYIYALYDSSNSRSAAFVANAATNDRSDTKVEGKYDNLVSENNNYSPYTENERTLLANYIVWGEDASIVAPVLLNQLENKGGTTTIEVEKALNGPYVELVYSTNVNVWGVFTYTDGSKTANEDFYLEAGTSSHKQYLDIFRSNGVGYDMSTSNLTMKSITFTNAELEQAESGDVRIFGMYSENKVIDTDKKEIYLTVGDVTVGAHLGLGGALTYLAKAGIYEGLTSKYGGNVVISTKTSTFGGDYYGSASSSKAKDGAVNLINNYDAGRQIQQSWYAEVGEENRYSRAFCKTESPTGKYWPYNPVQAGDVVSNPSQIIDYEINEAKGYIYVKARAMDWAKGQGSDKLDGTVKGGSTTKSYVENYYRLNSDGTLVINNRFIDWNGFTDMGNCAWASTELPAVYPIQSLNYYVSNFDGDGSWTDALESSNTFGAWGATATEQNQIGNARKVEEWFAWANGGDASSFGMGVYIPNVSRFTSGRSKKSNAKLTSGNNNSSSNLLKSKGLMSNMQSISQSFQGAYVSNTSYTAPGVDFRMEAYVPIEYSYVICLDTISNIRKTFKQIKDNGTVTNAGNSYEKVGLDAWARSDKKWTW